MRNNFAIYMDVVGTETKGDAESAKKYRDELESNVKEDLDFIEKTRKVYHYNDYHNKFREVSVFRINQLLNRIDYRVIDNREDTQEFYIALDNAVEICYLVIQLYGSFDYVDED